MSKRIIVFICTVLITFGLVTCTQYASNLNPINPTVNGASKQEHGFRIWWIQGFLPEENELIARLVEQWQQESGLKAELTLIPANNLDAEVQKSLEMKTPPDVLYSSTADTNLIPKLAWRDQLADVSELIEPLKSQYNPVALKAVYYQNSKTKQRSYYSVPIAQQTAHIFYWRNLLESGGLNNQDIPQKWEDFWKFWEQGQEQLQQRGQQNIYGLGLTMSALGTDTFLAFEQFLEAYDAKIVDDNGQLLLQNPEREHVTL